MDKQKVDGTVLVIGAGPVGLLAAAFLGQAGIPVLVVDARLQASAWSRAIGVSPPSLVILSRLGLDAELVRRGRCIQKVRVHSHRRQLGQVDFSRIGGEYPFMLSVGQAETESVLRGYLDRCPGVEIRWGVSAEALMPVDQPGAMLQFALTPVRSGQAGQGGAALAGSEGDCREIISPSMVLVCEGARSALRGLVEASVRPHLYPDSFVMADHPEIPGLGDLARLFFTPRGAVESFPVGGGTRRWIVQTTIFEPEPKRGFVAGTLASRVGAQLEQVPVGENEKDLFPFRVMKLCMKDYHHRLGKTDLVFLGDAAHLMPPIGGQGMNTGFGDVDWFLPLVIRAAKEGRELDLRAVRSITRLRRRAWRIAERRAWLSMRLGTIRGRIPSVLRNMILWLMLNGPLRARVPVDYAMLSIPGCCRKDE